MFRLLSIFDPRSSAWYFDKIRLVDLTARLTHVDRKNVIIPHKANRLECADAQYEKNTLINKERDATRAFQWARVESIS